VGRQVRRRGRRGSIAAVGAFVASAAVNGAESGSPSRNLAVGSIDRNLAETAGSRSWLPKPNLLRFVTLIIPLTLNSVAAAEQFSIRCERDAWHHYATFDTDTNRVVYETDSGPPFKGEITSSSTDELIFYLVQPGRQKYDLIWRPHEGIVTVIGLPDNPARPTIIMKCVKTNLRNILPFYDGIAPME